MTATKRGRGRPSLTGETGQRYQVTIPPTIAAKIRKRGKGSLSRGIILQALAAARWEGLQRSLCHSFDGQDRTYYRKVNGRQSLADYLDARMGLPPAPPTATEGESPCPLILWT
jgi:hypothetical protein